MGHSKCLAVGSICADQEPARQPLLEVVLGVAASRLRRLNQLRLYIEQSQRLKRSSSTKLSARCFNGAAKSTAGNLCVDPIQRLLGSHQGGDADHGLIPKHPHLDLTAVLEGGRH